MFLAAVCSWWESAARSSYPACGTPGYAFGSVLLIFSIVLILQLPGLPAERQAAKAERPVGAGLPPGCSCAAQPPVSLAGGSRRRIPGTRGEEPQYFLHVRHDEVVQDGRGSRAQRAAQQRYRRIAGLGTSGRGRPSTKRRSIPVRSSHARLARRSRP